MNKTRRRKRKVRRRIENLDRMMEWIAFADATYVAELEEWEKSRTGDDADYDDQPF